MAESISVERFGFANRASRGGYAKMGWLGMISRRQFVKTSVLTSTATIAERLAGGGIPAAGGMKPTALRFGVNFTPRKNWWYCWLDWDHAAIADDLAGIAGLGVDHIRIQCLWPFFQPGIANVSERALANLRSLLEEADRAGLDVEVTVLNGWMSGLSFLPAWVAPVARAQHGDGFNMFTSGAVTEAEKLLFRRLAETVGGHRRFLGFDIGNELGVLMGMNNPATSQEADAWAGELLGYCEVIAPGKFHVNGADHSHWFNDVGFSRPSLASQGKATVVHSYVHFTGVLDRYKYNEAAPANLAAYQIELAYAFQSDPSRRVWVEETGVGNEEMPESYKPEFMERSIRNIAATGKAWGVTWWCSHDIDPAVKGFSDYEYGLGLLDVENKQKPMGRKFAELIREFRRSPPAVVPRPTALVVPELGLSTKAWPPDWRFAAPYMKLVEQGITPAIVTESRAKDDAYLRARGITKLIALESVS